MIATESTTLHGVSVRLAAFGHLYLGVSKYVPLAALSLFFSNHRTIATVWALAGLHVAIAVALLRDRSRRSTLWLSLACAGISGSTWLHGWLVSEDSMSLFAGSVAASAVSAACAGLRRAPAPPGIHHVRGKGASPGLPDSSGRSIGLWGLIAGYGLLLALIIGPMAPLWILGDASTDLSMTSGPLPLVGLLQLFTLSALYARKRLALGLCAATSALSGFAWYATRSASGFEELGVAVFLQVSTAYALASCAYAGYLWRSRVLR